ncbi:unnamed protein product [Lymnaea stagnalis]|uniref:CABIT domain-containing protein n=1 Tax=Lymnaea stagnalis TaxID=6523 RepID=A0AAV2I758_LYMST
MAAYGSGEGIRLRIGSDALDVSEFVKECVLPECVCVTEGSYLSKTVQISKGDVILLKSCDAIKTVTLSYRNEGSFSWTEVTVPLECSHKFYVLPPKETSDEKRVVSLVSYPTISDLLLDCPTYFEATCSYDDPYLPGHSVKAGDRFRFVEIVRDLKDGQERLKVTDDEGNVITLSPDCRGNFCPLPDDQEYTLKDLVNLSPVQRRLKLVHNDADSRKGQRLKIAGDSPDEYTQVIKPKPSLNSSTSSSSTVSLDANDSLPDDFPGIVHLHKPQMMLTVSPFNDPDTVWSVPVTANLMVRIYSQDDYEIPAPKGKGQFDRVPLPLSSADDVPRHMAPSTPLPTQPLVPVKLNSFVDSYLPSFPVRAKVIDTTDSDPFYSKLLRDIEEVNVYRVEETRRLFVKDAKSDTVFSLSHDLNLSFIEYPEKFKTVLDLLHLPVGTEVTILEDIAADFPKPFSLRFGDIIRITTTNPQFIKMKHAARDCEVLKCLRLDPEGGEPMKLKLPLDCEISMVMTIDRNSRKMISLQDLLSGTAPIPVQEVASLPDELESKTLQELPVDLKILKCMKETFLVVASTRPVHLPMFSSARQLRQSSSCPTPSFKSHSQGEIYGASASGSPSPRRPSAPLTNIGLPLSSGIVIAFLERLDLFDLNVEASEADYIRIPIEKMTYGQYEERERLRKLNLDYEDVEFGSSSTIDESCSKGLNLTRAGSTGLLERKDKMTKLDKVRRFSKALHPKHWRQSKAEPEPLPPPSAMGLMALAARPHDGQSNEYEQQHLEPPSKSNLTSDGECLNTEEDDGNFYEDVEIGPVKAATFAGPPASRQTGAFSGPTHRSMPMPRLPARPVAHRNGSKKTGAAPLSFDDGAQIGPRRSEAAGDVQPSSDFSKQLNKARNWATNLSTKLNMKPKGEDSHKYDQERPGHSSPRVLAKFPLSAREKKETANDKSRLNETANQKTPSQNRAGTPPVKTPPTATMLEPDLNVNATSVASSSSDKEKESAPIAPKRRKALKKLAESGSTDNDDKAGIKPPNNDVVLEKDLETEERKKSLEVVPEKDTTVSGNRQASQAPPADGEDMWQKQNGGVDKLEPPRPKPRNINKPLPGQPSSPPLPPRGELPPRKRPDKDGILVPHSNTIGGSPSGGIERPKPPPKPRVSRQSEV